MITILYIILIYTLLGSLVYLIGQHYAESELTPFKEELFLFLGFVFKPVIIIILMIDGYILPTIRQKITIGWIRKQYNKQLKNKDLTEDERQIIIHKRDAMIVFLSNVTKSETNEYEE